MWHRGVGFLRYFRIKQLPNFLLASPILSLALCSLIHYAKSEPRKFFSLGFHASTEDKNSAAVLFIPEEGLRSSINHRPRKVSSKMQGITFDQKLVYDFYHSTYCTVCICTFCHNYLVLFFFPLLLSLLFLLFLVENHSPSSKKQMTKGEVHAQHSEKYEPSGKIGYLSVFVLPFVLHLGFLALTAIFVMHVQVWIPSICPQFAICNMIQVAKLVRKCQVVAIGKRKKKILAQYLERREKKKKNGLLKICLS